MEAVVGDRIVVAAAMLDGPVRDGQIMEVGSSSGDIEAVEGHEVHLRP